MNNSLKGACLSGLIYPGLGQIIQKHYFRGILLIIIVTTCLFIVVLTASREIQIILTNLESSSGGYDIKAIFRETAKIPQGQDNVMVSISSVFIFCCWAIGIVDAYLVGKRMDLNKGARDQTIQSTGKVGS